MIIEFDAMKNYFDKTNIVYYNDIILYYLNKDYIAKTNFLYNLSLHIEKLYDNFILTFDDRRKVILQLNNLINNTNKFYNDSIDKLSKNITKTKKTENNFSEEEINDSKKILSSPQIKWLNSNNIKHALNIFDILKKTYTTNIFQKDLELINFKEIDKSLRELINIIGAPTVEDILKNYNFNINHLVEKDKNIIFILNKILIPYSCKYILSKRIDKKTLYLEFVENQTSSDKFDLLLENNFKLKIRNNNYKYLLEINCFINTESLNILSRTCKITNNYLYNKKLEFINYINKNLSINTTFKKEYIKNICISNFLLTNFDIKKKILDDYAYFIRYSGLNFKNIMIDFLQMPLKSKFNLIKILLLGNSININIAALLFGITKDQKESVDQMSKPTLLSDVIFRNLKYSNQNKLKKSNALIYQELEKLKNIIPEDIDLKKQIVMSKNMPAYVKKLALNRLEELKTSNSEHYKHQTYIRKLIDFPWTAQSGDDDIFTIIKNDREACKKFINDASIKMDEYVYGHEKCKETIIELIGKWISNSSSTGKSIGLLGPPGVGKTLFAKALGKILNIPFSQINLGGVDDAALLTGHSFTYSSAQNGLIIDNIIQGGAPRCVMFFDEIDKTGIKHGVNEIMNVLIHLTDPNSNDKFNDKFFQEITFPLNKVLFVFSYNDPDKVDKILLDRLEQIPVDAYTTQDKINIFNKHLIQEVCKDINFNHNILNFNTEVITHIIENYTHEAGVRNLRRKIEKLLNKINLDKLYGTGLFKDNLYDELNRINITIDLIDTYLEKPQIYPKKIFHEDLIGVVNGMYAMSTGPGGIMPILIYKLFTGPDNFKLKLTGQQKSVMKESINFAFTIAMNLLKEKFIEEFTSKYKKGLHIHTPDGSTPKDGPSAGGAFTTAFISIILNKKVKKNIAMTGEIETNGYITAIGGLECKLLGAKKAGINLVFVPKENEIDYNKIIEKNKNLVDNNFKIMIVNHISKILEYAIIDIDNYDTVKNTYDKTFNYELYIK
jgi:endopeptidase La